MWLHVLLLLLACHDVIVLAASNRLSFVCFFPQVELECLNSIAPPPLNWHMWCPGKDAKVMGWTDKSGAAHRSITLRPQKNMTSTMIIWFITSHVLGLMPPVVEFQGNVSV